MAKKRKGPFGKKASRFRAAAAAGAAARAGETATSASTRNNSFGRQPWKREANGNGMPNGTPENVMQELARNTRNQAAHWDQGTRLRERPVTFISGGFIEPSKELKPAADCPPTNTTVVSIDEPKNKDIDTTTASTSEPLVSIGVTDVLPIQAQDSPAEDSDSSGEVILFKGRGGNRNKQPGSPSHTPIRVASPSKALNSSIQNDAASDDDGSNAAMDDYISNLLLDDMQDTMQHSHMNSRELGGSDNEIVLEQPEQTGKHTMGAHTYANSSEFELALSTADEQLEEDSDDDVWGLAETMDDEHLAQLFAKQEELGMGSGELLLLDADSMRKAPKRKAKKTGQPALAYTKGFKSTDGSYPSAEAVAKVFEQLNVDFNLSDSDLEAQLKNSWQKDRLRKKEKKRAREELREKGLLGKNANPNDPRVKYPNGIHIDDVKAELRDFLLGSEDRITLPPMDPCARKIIHEIAHAFNITSKSTGSGDQRRPTLSRTKATFTYNESHFQSIFARFRRRYLPRLDGNRDNAGGAGRRGNSGAATVRHGEIVGGSAPEIGQTNKGRTMLEKMGWSRGMALGAMDNQGMTQPIEHVVIRSKAGLG